MSHATPGTSIGPPPVCASVVGVGETEYSRRSEHSALELQLLASLRPDQVDGVIPIGITGAPVEEYVADFGAVDLRFSAVVPHGGASAVGALQLAAAAITGGLCTTVLVPFGRNTSSGAKAGVRIHQMPQFHLVSEFERAVGAIAPAQLYAPMARRHMELYGTTSEQFGEIAVATREHALLNGTGLMTKPMTLEDHQASKMITDPFRLFDCSLESDGGAAFVVTSAERARDLARTPVDLLGSAMGHPDSPSSITQRPDLTRLGVAKAADLAFAAAGVTHADLDVAEIYDCFTYIVLCQLEDLGFCAKGEGGPFVADGRLRPGGELPTNTHGGLLSQAHMLAVNHVVELVRQLRGTAGPAQVQGAAAGLVTGYGDMGDGGGAILRRGTS